MCHSIRRRRPTAVTQEPSAHPCFAHAMNEPLHRLAEVASTQHAAITARQAIASGMSSDQLRRKVEAGVLRRVGSHTFRSPFAPTTALADLAALVLDCGQGAFASGPSAAALHGFDGFRLRPPFHVTLLRGRNIQRAHHHIHTSTELPLIDRATVEGVRAMSATRTLIDLSRFVAGPALTAALDAAFRDGLTSESLLHRRITALRATGRHGIPRLLAVIEGAEAIRGGHSWLERRFLELCAEAGLPRPLTQQVLRAHRQPPRARRLPIRWDPDRRRAARLPLAPHDGADVATRAG